VNENTLKQINSMVEVVKRGGTKTSYEDTFVKITVYRVGTVIRVDIKEK
jgi:hypothetical protein